MTTDNDPSLRKMADEVHRVIRAEKQRNRFGLLARLALVTAIVAALLWWLWPVQEKTQWQTYTVDRSDMILTAMATGNLQPKSEVSVGAEISGLINEVLVTENDQVSRGQVLARFDTEELDLALQQATAGLALARASLFEATATLEEAVIDERRVRSLVQRNMLPQASLDEAVAKRKRAQGAQAYARATVQQAEATISQARTRLEKAVITAPIDGVVLQRSIEP
ncbi:MAG: efflux RND transporter periplasmic adaptor subunit, partial [Halioglobus sp.]|nr:efflux RND transporter periplasmic adaptor subunit [Halioglobus sp.]